MQEIAELSLLENGIISLPFAELAQRVVKVHNIVDFNPYWHCIGNKTCTYITE